MPDPASLHLWQNWGRQGSHNPSGSQPRLYLLGTCRSGREVVPVLPLPRLTGQCECPGWQQRAPGPPVFSPPGCSGQVWCLFEAEPSGWRSGEAQAMASPGPRTLCTVSAHLPCAPGAAPGPACCPVIDSRGPWRPRGRVPPLFHGTAALGFAWTSRPRRTRRIPENSGSWPRAIALPEQTWAHVGKQEPQREKGSALMSTPSAASREPGLDPGQPPPPFHQRPPPEHALGFLWTISSGSWSHSQ